MGGGGGVIRTIITIISGGSPQRILREDPNAVGRGRGVAEVRGVLISEIERAS